MGFWYQTYLQQADLNAKKTFATKPPFGTTNRRVALVQGCFGTGLLWYTGNCLQRYLITSIATYFVGRLQRYFIIKHKKKLLFMKH